MYGSLISKRACSAAILALLCSGVALSGCAERTEAREDIKKMTQIADKSLNQIQDADTGLSPLTELDTPWFGNQAVPVERSESLPSELNDAQSLVITFDQPLTLEQVAARIQAATNVRVMVEKNQMNDTQGAASLAASASGNLADERFLPADGLEVTGGRMVWQGSLSNLLDQIADRFDAQWTYNAKAIQISQHVTRTYMLHSLAGVVDVGGSVKTGSGNADSGLPQQTVDTVTKLSIWEEIQKSVESIIGQKARASFSPATGTITVSGYPSAVKQAEDYLRMQNKLRLRRVAIETRVLSVNLKREYETSLDIQAVFKEAFNGQGFSFSTATVEGTRGMTVGVLSALPEGVTQGSGSLTFNALEAIADKITVEHTGTLVTLSDQPAPLQVATKRDYVKRVSASIADGGSTTSIEPGTIDIGLTMNVLPRVIEQDRVMLRVALGITDLIDMGRFQSGQSTVQLPEVETTGFLQNTVLQSGETLVLAGFERKSANDQQTGKIFPWNFLLGGGYNYGKGREVRVLLIRAVILPEEPLNVVNPITGS